MGRKRCVPCRSLATLWPERAKQWYGERNAVGPDEVLPGSNKTYWWTCTEGHAWKARVADRVRGDGGCPICLGRIGAPDKMVAADPVLAPQWHPRNELSSDQVHAGSATLAWWQCTHCGHEFRSQVQVRARRRDGRGER